MMYGCKVHITTQDAPIGLSLSYSIWSALRYKSTRCLNFFIWGTISCLTWRAHSTLFRLRTMISGLNVLIFISTASYLVICEPQQWVGDCGSMMPTLPHYLQNQRWNTETIKLPLKALAAPVFKVYEQDRLQRTAVAESNPRWKRVRLLTDNADQTLRYNVLLLLLLVGQGSNGPYHGLWYHILPKHPHRASPFLSGASPAPLIRVWARENYVAFLSVFIGGLGTVFSLAPHLGPVYHGPHCQGHKTPRNFAPMTAHRGKH